MKLLSYYSTGTQLSITNSKKKKITYEATPEVSVIGIPLGAETAGSLIELSGRGSADVKPNERAAAMNGAITTMMKE